MNIKYLVVLLCFAILLHNCGESSISETETNKTVPSGTDSLVPIEQVDEPVIELSYEEERYQEFKNAIDISVDNNKTRTYEGLLGDTPIYLSYYIDYEGELSGRYLYPNNGVTFPLSGEFVGGDVYLTRRKNGEIREVFDLMGTVEGMEGTWKKEEMKKSLQLTEVILTKSQREHFIAIIEDDLPTGLDVWLFEVDDFENLILDNDELWLSGQDGGTSGSTEVKCCYKALSIDEDGDSYFAIIYQEINESWLSLEESNEGEDYDLTDENTFDVSINVYKYSNGVSDLIDWYATEGNWSVDVAVLHNAFIVDAETESKVLIWNEETKKLTQH